jgi:hypothetical protein
MLAAMQCAVNAAVERAGGTLTVLGARGSTRSPLTGCSFSAPNQ